MHAELGLGAPGKYTFKAVCPGALCSSLLQQGAWIGRRGLRVPKSALLEQGATKTTENKIMIDLHTHSTFSDGTQTPEELVDEAVQLGLTALALTDHDNTAGLPRFLSAAEGKPLRAIPGVELSVNHQPGSMHMLGYFIRHDDPDLNERLIWIRSGRDKRNAAILKNLGNLGMALTHDEVAAMAGEDVIGRPHIAAAMVERGYVSDLREAFNRYLARGKPAYERRSVMDPVEGIRVIRHAGGVPVLAHPFSLQMEGRALRELVKGLADSGLQGIEVYYPGHARNTQDQLLHLARDFDLIATGGSDYHGKTKPDLCLGRGFGSLNVPDDVVDRLENRRS